MSIDRSHTEVFADPAGDFGPTPAHIKARMLAWANDHGAAGASKRGSAAGTSALGVVLGAAGGLVVARLLLPRRKRPTTEHRSGIFGTGLLRLAVMLRTGAWLVPLVARAVKHLMTPTNPQRVPTSPPLENTPCSAGPSPSSSSR